MIRRTLTSLIFLLAIAITSAAQNYVFYDKSDGLSSTLVKHILEDSDGMVWIATENGLNRYDGVRFVQYFHNSSDPRSIASNHVISLFEDSKGRLWVSTHSGVQLYDRMTDSFSPLPRIDDSPSGQVSLVIERMGGELWAIGNSVCRITVGDDSEIKLTRLPVDPSLCFSDYAIEDKDFNLWTAKLNRGVVKSSPDGRITSYLSDGSCQLLGLCQSDDGEVMAVSSNLGLLRYDSHSDSFVPVSGNYTGPGAGSFFQMSSNYFLIGTKAGITVLDRRSGRSWAYRSTDVQVDLSEYNICCISRDKGGNLWLGAYQKGVIRISPRLNNFMYIGHKSIFDNAMDTDVATALLRTADGILYVGTSRGLVAYVPSADSIFPEAIRVLENRIRTGVSALYEDSRGNLWVALFGGGILCYNPSTGSTTRLDYSRLKGEKPATAIGFAEDEDGELWIATRGTGLYAYDLRSGVLRGMSALNGDIPSFLTDILYSDGKLYLGSYDGACMLDLVGNGSFVFISNDNIINCISEAGDGTIAFGCDDGLMLWNWADGKRRIPLGSAGSGGEVRSILYDNDGYIWLSTGGSLCRLSRDYEPAAVFYAEDGIVNTEFSKKVSWKDPDGVLWFGGFDGVTFFQPREISAPAQKWTARITELYLHNRPITAATRSGRWQVMDAPIYKTDEIHLCHSDNSFTMLFAAVEHNAPERLQFMWSIDGEEWHIMPRGTRRMSFSGLAPGTYNFRLKARDVSVDSDIVQLRIVIHPAVWASAPAVIIYILILLAIAGAVIYWRINHAKAQQQLREYRQADEINNFKLQFFVDIYHELKSPLTLIMGPLKKLIASDDDPGRQHNYRLMQRNIERIMLLMNQLLDLRRIDKGRLKLERKPTDLVAYLEEIVQSYAEYYLSKNINLVFEHEGVQSLTVCLDSDNFDKAIHNLLSNAYKFTPENGEVKLLLSRQGQGKDERACIRVRDNGIGIKPEELENIFRRFYQAKNGQNVYRGGAGIGLDLTRAVVELHGGEIHAENNTPDPGSTFIVTLPLSPVPEALASAEPEETPESKPAHGNSRPELLPVLEENPSAGGGTPKTRIKVLIADNDAELRRYIAAELGTDFRVLEAADGQEALDMTLSHKPDIIVSDVKMPRMSGTELCAKVKRNININHIPVILLSGKSEESDALEGLKTGADSYIPKPVSIDLLRTTVANLVESRRMLRNSFSARQNVAETLAVPEVETPDDKLMARIMKVLEANMGNSRLTIEELAGEIGISRVHLHRKLKELTNQTTGEFIRNARLTRAAKILSEGKHSIAEVASLVGFENQANFATAFRKMYGMSPRDYMNRDSSIAPESQNKA